MDDNTNKFLDRIEAKLDKFDTKFDTIQSRLDGVEKTLVRNTVSLEEHVRRTNILEKKLEPIENDISQAHGAIKLIGILGVVVGIVVGMFKIYGE